MKKIVLLAAIGAASIGFTQKGNITNAAMAYKDYQENQASDPEKAAKDIIDAKKYIDEAAVHEDTKDDPRCLMYQGQIYIDYSIFSQASDNPGFEGADVEKIAEDGFKALKKSKEVDVKGRYHDKVDSYAGTYRVMLSNMGSAAYGEQKYMEAMGGLLGAAQFGDVMGILDTNFYYYGGAAAFNAEQYDVAAEAFGKCVDVGFQLASSSYYYSQSLQKQGKVEEAEKMLTGLVAKFPKNKDVLIELTNLYIDTDRKADAEKVLAAAIELDPNNTALIYTSGTIYENMGRFEDAEKAYNKLLTIKADDMDAKFALGGLYFNKGADLYNEANALPFGDPQIDIKSAQSKEFFQKALPFLEEAAVASPNDKIVLESLKAVYGKLGMTEKFMEIKKQISEL